VIIDNIAFPFRLYTSYSIEQRISVIENFASELRNIISLFSCTILTINQMTTKFLRCESEQGLFVFKPSLGQTWAQLVDHRLIFHALGEQARKLELDHSIYQFTPLYTKAQIQNSSTPKNLALNKHGLVDVHGAIK